MLQRTPYWWSLQTRYWNVYLSTPTEKKSAPHTDEQRAVWNPMLLSLSLHSDPPELPNMNMPLQHILFLFGADWLVSLAYAFSSLCLAMPDLVIPVLDFVLGSVRCLQPWQATLHIHLWTVLQVGHLCPRTTSWNLKSGHCIQTLWTNRKMMLKTRSSSKNYFLNL